MLALDRPGHAPPGAPALVLLHGWCLNGAVFDELAARLATEFDLIRIDLPGHGRSAWPAGFDDLPGAELAGAFAEAVGATLAALEPRPRRALVLGWSLGGQVALELARRRPAQVAGLVLVATTPRFVAAEEWPHGMAPATLERFATQLRTDRAATVRDFLELQVRGTRQAEATLHALRLALESRGEAQPVVLERGLELLRDTDLRATARRLAVPSLVLAGRYDRVTPPAAAEALAELLPRATLQVIDRAAHALFLSHPQEVETALRAFAASLPEEQHRTEPARVARAFSAASQDYDAEARLQARVREELLGRLGELGMQGGRVLDLGAGTGSASQEIRRRWPRSEVYAVDLSAGMLARAGERLAWRDRLLGGRFGAPFARVRADAHRLPFADGSMDVVFSNLMLQWCQLDVALREIRRVARDGALLVFSTFGPGTLAELRRAWEAADDQVHVSAFLDPHDIGAALARAGFAEPVLDVDRLVEKHRDVRGIMQSLKRIGAHNAAAGRPRGLTGPRRLGAMTAAYERERDPRDGLLPASWEVVYASAWAARVPPATAGDGGETFIDVGAIRRR